MHFELDSDIPDPPMQAQPRTGGKHGHSLPLGVTKKGDRYRARISWRNKTRDLGLYQTPHEAKRIVTEAKAVVSWKNASNLTGVPLCRRLRIWQFIQGLSDKKIASSLKVSCANYRRLTCGARKPSLKMAGRLAEILDISLDALVGQRSSHDHRETTRRVPGLPIRLVRLRDAAGLTQQELATRSGVHVETISYLERGVRAPSLALAWRLCQALECPLDDLVQPAGVPLLRQCKTRPKHVRVRETLGKKDKVQHYDI